MSEQRAKPFPEPVRGDHRVVFYTDPMELRDEQVDPLLLSAVRTINSSGWVWTAESCQGHPEAHFPWGLRPMLRLVTRWSDAGRLLGLLAAATARRNSEDDEVHIMGVEMWPWCRPSVESPRYFEVLVYVGPHSASVGHRNAGCHVFDLLAELVARRAPDA